MSILSYFINNLRLIFKLTLEHIQVAMIAVIISTVIGVAIGILITRIKKLATPVIGIAGIIYKDDLKFFPPYYAAPVVRDDLLAKTAQVADILNKSAGKISDITMATLNYAVDRKKQPAEEVARDFLKSQNLIK